MSSKHIVVVWPSGNVLCEGESALDHETRDENDEQLPETLPEEDETEEACPPTKRSPESESGVFPVARPIRVA